MRLTEQQYSDLLNKRTPSKKKESKYRNKKKTFDGIEFDSKKEAMRYQYLKHRELAGEISELKHHQSFDIVINGMKVCAYEADFTYYIGETRVVEDVKSEITRKLPVYRLKKKLLKAVHGIDIIEV